MERTEGRRGVGWLILEGNIAFIGLSTTEGMTVMIIMSHPGK